MKLKKRKTSVWCSKEAQPINISGYGFVYNYNKYGSKFRKCKQNYLKIHNTNKDLKVPPKVKCPLCKKRFKPRIRQCHDSGCWHFFVPPHKKVVKV